MEGPTRTRGLLHTIDTRLLRLHLAREVTHAVMPEPYAGFRLAILRVEIHTPDQACKTVCDENDAPRNYAATIEAADRFREMQNHFGGHRLAGSPSVQIKTVEVRRTPAVYLGRCDIEDIRITFYDPHRQMRKGEEQPWRNLGAIGRRWNVPQLFVVQCGDENGIVCTYGEVLQKVVFRKRSDGCQTDLRTGLGDMMYSICEVPSTRAGRLEKWL